MRLPNAVASRTVKTCIKNEADIQCVCKYECFNLLSLLQRSDLQSEKRKKKIWSTSCCALLNIFTKYNTNKILIVKVKGIFTIAATHKTHVGTGIEREGAIEMPHLIFAVPNVMHKQNLVHGPHQQIKACLYQHSHWTHCCCKLSGIFQVPLHALHSAVITTQYTNTEVTE